MKAVIHSLCFISIFFFSFSLTSYATTSQEALWQLKKDSNGIQVYTRPVIKQDNQSSNSAEQLLAFRGITHIKSSMIEMLHVMRDVHNFDKWLHNCYAPSIIEVAENDTRIVYQKTKAPWPTSDRDSVLKQVLEKKGEDYYLWMNSITHSNAPETENLVRIPYFKGHLSFHPVSEDTLKVIYEASFDSGGNIPSFVSDLFILDVPFYSLNNLKVYVEKQQKI